MWSRLATKYDSMREGWCSKEVVGPYGMGVWNCIKKGLGRFF